MATVLPVGSVDTGEDNRQPGRAGSTCDNLGQAPRLAGSFEQFHRWIVSCLSALAKLVDIRFATAAEAASTGCGVPEDGLPPAPSEERAESNPPNQPSHRSAIRAQVPAGQGVQARARGARRRLLVISYFFPPDGAVGGLRWAGLTKYLARIGWDVCVVTAAPNADRDSEEGIKIVSRARAQTLNDWYRSLAAASIRSEISNDGGASVAEQPGTFRTLRREVGALLAFPDHARGWILRAAMRARSLVTRFRPDVVVSTGPPHSAHVVAWLATAGKSTRWVIDLRDPWAALRPRIWGSASDHGSWTIEAGNKWLERHAFKVADGVITNTREMAGALKDRYPDIHISCVPNGVDYERLPAETPRRFGGLAIAYVGTLYGPRDLGPVLRGLRSFLDLHPAAASAGLQLRVCGHAWPDHMARLRVQIAKLRLESFVELLGVVPQSDALSVAGRSHLAVVLAQDQALMVPAKLYELVGLGVPTLVVAEEGSAAAREGKRLGSHVVESSDVDGIVHVLEQISCRGSDGRPNSPRAAGYDQIAIQMSRLLLDGQEMVLPQSGTQG